MPRLDAPDCRRAVTRPCRAPAIALAAAMLPTLARADAQDVPPNMVALFDQPECPAGWSPYPHAQGRLLLGFTDTDTYVIGPGSGGDPMAPGQAPTHSHGFNGSVDLGSWGLAAAKGGNHGGAAAGQQRVPQQGDLPVEDASFGIGFVQYTACVSNKTAEQPAASPAPDDGGWCFASDPFPPGTLGFFDSISSSDASCPAGWQPATMEAGYVATWTSGGTPGYCAQLNFDGTDLNRDGILSGRGSNPGLIGGGEHNELDSFQMSVYEGDCGTGTLLQVYGWEVEQQRPDFNLNYSIPDNQIIASDTWSTSSGLNLGIYIQQGAQQPQYNFYSQGGEILLDEIQPTNGQLAHTLGGDDRFSVARSTIAVDARFLVPFTSKTQAGKDALGGYVGIAPANQAPIGASHTHGVFTRIDVPDHHFLLAGGSTEHLGRPGSHSVSGTTTSTSGSLPYVQLLLCQRCAGAPAPLPTGLAQVVTQSSKDCELLAGEPGADAQQWKEDSHSLGRFTVGLAPTSDPTQVGQTFGDQPLAPLGTAGHQHTFGGSTDLASHGIAGLSGCFISCTKPAAAGSVGLNDGIAEPVWSGIPYLATRACRPCGNAAAGQSECGN